jgi:hypothetical protein
MMLSFSLLVSVALSAFFFDVSNGQKKQNLAKKGFCLSEHCSPGLLVFLSVFTDDLRKPQKH